LRRDGDYPRGRDCGSLQRPNHSTRGGSGDSLRLAHDCARRRGGKLLGANDHAERAWRRRGRRRRRRLGQHSHADAEVTRAIRDRAHDVHTLGHA
jgi:hypothetical protein